MVTSWHDSAALDDDDDDGDDDGSGFGSKGGENAADAEEVCTACEESAACVATKVNEAATASLKAEAEDAASESTSD